MPLRLLRRMGILGSKKPEKWSGEANKVRGSEESYSKGFRQKFSAILTRFYRPQQDEEELVEGGRKDSRDN